MTAPASEDGDVAEDKVDDENEDDDTEGLVKAMQEVLDNLEELNKELRGLVSPTPGDTSTQQPPVHPSIDVWDTGKAWEQESDLYPKASRDDIRLYNLMLISSLPGARQPTDLE